MPMEGLIEKKAGWNDFPLLGYAENMKIIPKHLWKALPCGYIADTTDLGDDPSTSPRAALA